MSENDPLNPDVFRPPSDRKLYLLGEVLFRGIRNSISHSRKHGVEAVVPWMFDLEEYDMMVDPEGRTRNPNLAVFREEALDTEAARSFVVMSTRQFGEEDQNPVMDLYNLTVPKNTELITGIGKATHDKEFIRVLTEESYASAIDADEKERPPEHYVEVTENTPFRARIMAQLEYLQCDETETDELLGMLEHSKPSDILHQAIKQMI